jgi:hypothetical protein
MNVISRDIKWTIFGDLSWNSSYSSLGIHRFSGFSGLTFTGWMSTVFISHFFIWILNYISCEKVSMISKLEKISQFIHLLYPVKTFVIFKKHRKWVECEKLFMAILELFIGQFYFQIHVIKLQRTWRFPDIFYFTDLRPTRGAKKIPNTVLKTRLKIKETAYTLVFGKNIVVCFQSQYFQYLGTLKIFSGTWCAGPIHPNAHKPFVWLILIPNHYSNTLSSQLMIW